MPFLFVCLKRFDMNYTVGKNYIEIVGKEDFDIKQTLECGQVFSYKRDGDDFLVFSDDKFAKVKETTSGYFIETKWPAYFENYFDLKTDYSKIKTKLNEFPILVEPIKFGHGIRILRQNLFETLISFIISANNNIKRIQMILFRLREKLGKKIGELYSFPTREQMLTVDEKFFSDIGAGYRAKYLYNVIRQVDEKELSSWGKLTTPQIRSKLISLSGVGPKVADCVLLFGYGAKDVFPVDTWICQMYNKYYEKLSNREHIRENLTKQFENLSGYAQQYLFYFMRSFE